jgi:hypothetical protein
MVMEVAMETATTAANGSTTLVRRETLSEILNAFGSESAFETAQRMAKALSSSTLVPTSYQGNLANCMIAMELSARIGASVFMVMQSLDIIHGRPSWRANFLIATVNTCGRFTPLRFRFEGKPGTDEWGCRAVAKDRASGEELVGTLVTIRLAKSEEWYGRKGSKWPTMPEQMLQYRAASFWVRLYAPELSLGMQTSDEAVDSGPEPQVSVLEQLREQPVQPETQPPADPPKRTRKYAHAQQHSAPATQEVPTGEGAAGASNSSATPADPAEGKRVPEQASVSGARPVAPSGHQGDARASASPEHRAQPGPEQGKRTDATQQSAPVPPASTADPNETPVARAFKWANAWNAKYAVGEAVEWTHPKTGEKELTTTAAKATVFGNEACVEVNDGQGGRKLADLKNLTPLVKKP